MQDTLGQMDLDHFPSLRKIVPSPRNSRHASTKKLAHFANTGHHTRECPIPTCPPPTLPPNYKSQFNEHHFLLSKLKSGKVKAKFIGTHMKGKLPRQLWVPKALVTHVKGPKFAWVPKPQK